MSKRLGFTLIELLVVVSIIALLIAILLPALGRARMEVKRIQCASHMRQLSVAYVNYASESKDILANGHTLGSGTWVLGGNTQDSLRNGTLWKHAGESLKVYRCPGDSSKHLRSYSVNSYLNGEAVGSPYSVLRFTEIRRTSSTLVFIEENDYRGGDTGSNMGSWMLEPTGDRWTDFVATFHGFGTNLGFADGHGSFRRWRDQRTLTLDFYAMTPGNPDLSYMQSIIDPKRQ